MTIIKDSTNDDLKMMAGDSGTLLVSGLNTSYNLTVTLWLIDPETGSHILSKSASSNNLVSTTINISSEDTKELCLYGSARVYNYGITISGDNYGVHTAFPGVGLTKNFIVYKSGYFN